MEDLEIKDIEKNNKNPLPRQKAYKKIALIGGVVVIMLLFKFILQSSSSTKVEQKEFYGDGIKIIGDTRDDDTDVASNIFNNISAPKIDDNTQDIKALKKANEKKEEELQKLKKKVEELSRQGSQTQSSPFASPFWKKNIPNQEIQADEAVYNSRQDFADKPNMSTKKEEVKTQLFEMWENKETPLVEKKNITSHTEDVTEDVKSKKEDEGEEEIETIAIIPSGSIALVYLEHGFLTGTMSNGNNGLQPTQATMVSEFFLPMGKTFDFRGGVFNLEAKGSLSTHRANLKLIRLSGYEGDELIDIPLEGYVTDISSGIGGLAGQVVSKQNELFMASLFAFTAQGVAQNSVASTQSISNTGTGAVITNDPASAFTNSLVGGFGKGAEAVGTQIMDIAKQMEAVIEVLGSQYMIVHITQPFILRKEVVFSQSRVKKIKKKQNEDKEVDAKASNIGEVRKMVGSIE